MRSTEHVGVPIAVSASRRPAPPPGAPPGAAIEQRSSPAVTVAAAAAPAAAGAAAGAAASSSSSSTSSSALPPSSMWPTDLRAASWFRAEPVSMGEVILLLQQQMLSAPPPSSPSSSSSDFVAVLIVPASALTLTAFVLGAGMSAPERVSVAVVSFDSVRRVLCACFRCRPTLTRAFPKGCHCRWLCAGVAAAHRHRVLGRYVHAGRPQRPSSLTPSLC
jgi:hypothetical protein